MHRIVLVLIANSHRPTRRRLSCVALTSGGISGITISDDLDSHRLSPIQFTPPDVRRIERQRQQRQRVTEGTAMAS